MKKRFMEFADKIRSASEKENKSSLFEKVGVGFLYALVLVIVITCIATTVLGDGNTYFDYTEPDIIATEDTTENTVIDVTDTSGISGETTLLQETTTDVQETTTGIY